MSSELEAKSSALHNQNRLPPSYRSGTAHSLRCTFRTSEWWTQTWKILWYKPWLSTCVRRKLWDRSNAWAMSLHRSVSDSRISSYRSSTGNSWNHAPRESFTVDEIDHGFDCRWWSQPYCVLMIEPGRSPIGFSWGYGKVAASHSDSGSNTLSLFEVRSLLKLTDKDVDHEIQYQ